MRAIFFIPSFYGALGWTLTFVLYLIGPLTWKPFSLETIAIFAAFYMLSLTSTGLMRIFYERRLLSIDVPYSVNGLARVIIALHCIGLFGLVIYIIDFSRELGGLEGFFLILLSDSLEI